MDTQSLQRIKDIIGKAQEIAIAVGPNPSVDDMAAGLSLSLALNAVNKKTTVVSPTEPIVELSNLVGIDKVQTSFSGSSSAGDLIVSFPYREGDIEKVSYTIDAGFLNIVVKAGEQGLSFTPQDVRFSQGSSGNAELIFVVGTPRLQDITGLFNPETVQSATIINIDNREENEGFGNVVLVSPRFSSVSEQVSDLLLSLGLDFDQDIAQNLMGGISFATGNFQDPKTSYVAFEIASILMKKGARRLSPIGGGGAASRLDRRPSPFDTSYTPSAAPIAPTTAAPSKPRFSPSRDDWQPNPLPPQPQPAPQVQVNEQDKKDINNPPADWLTPKVYKGSSIS